MADNRDPKQKQPGEKDAGKYHYNPGNQSGKVADIVKPETERANNRDRIENRDEPHGR
ncbi:MULTISPECIES: hypothetical protein [unclassified Bradyrhizobium]|uniref:hypothetical protein n=1 Tax=unclassified Bradyrhizobium TaxID=2631580 RepID=UPI0028E8A3ED|nr:MULTISPECIES: hypothetical protein [unclassified Bradyrhizobium]